MAFTELLGFITSVVYPGDCFLFVRAPITKIFSVIYVTTHSIVQMIYVVEFWWYV